LLRLVKSQKYGNLSEDLEEVDELLDDLPFRFHSDIADFFQSKRDSCFKRNQSGKPYKRGMNRNKSHKREESKIMEDDSEDKQTFLVNSI
jgi:hypothetical protein